MPEVHFITHDGDDHCIEIADGISLMEAAVRNDVPGIEADCGGALACATCHIYIDAKWSEKVGVAGQDEQDMLEYCLDVRPCSRLSCQVVMRGDLAGLVVSVPENQGGI